MEKGLLIIERMVLESILDKEKNIEEISEDTGLDKRLLINIIPNFIFKNIIVYKNGYYYLNSKEKNKWIKKINEKSSVKEELKDVFASLVNEYFKNESGKTDLKLRKIWLSPYEQKIFNMHLNSLEEFVSNIENDKKRGENDKLCDKQVVFWGHSKYSSIIDSFLNVG